jgi:chromosome partitioning protein
MVKKRLNPALKEQRFLFTMVDGRKKNHRSYREYMRGKYDATVMSSIVRTCTTLSVSARNGTTVFDADVMARGAVDYANVADEWLRIMEIHEPEDQASESASTAPESGLLAAPESGADQVQSTTTAQENAPSPEAAPASDSTTRESYFRPRDPYYRS